MAFASIPEAAVVFPGAAELAPLGELVRSAVAAQSELAPVEEYEAVVREVWSPQQVESPFRLARRAHGDAL